MKLTRQNLSEYPGFFLTMFLIGFGISTIILFVIWFVAGAIFRLPDARDIVTEYLIYGGFPFCLIVGGGVMPWLLHSRAWVHFVTWILCYLGIGTAFCIPLMAIQVVLGADLIFYTTLPEFMGIDGQRAFIYALSLIICLPICGLAGACCYAIYFAILGRETLEKHAEKKYKLMIDDEVFSLQPAIEQ